MGMRTLAVWAHPGCATLADAAAEVAAELHDGGFTVAVVAGCGTDFHREVLSRFTETLLVYTPEEFASFREEAVANVVGLLHRRHDAVLILGLLGAGGPPPCWASAAEHHVLLLPADPAAAASVSEWVGGWQRAGRPLPHLLVEPRPEGPPAEEVSRACGLELMGTTADVAGAREERRVQNRERIRRIIQADRSEAGADRPPVPSEIEPDPELVQDLVQTVELLAALGRRRQALEQSTAAAQEEFDRLRSAMLGCIDSDEDPVDGIMEEQVRALVQAKARLRAARRERSRLIEEIRGPAARLRRWLDSVADEAG
ncbi:hypothetical protein [Caldinitratiruptor microaerophilus]|uniref:Uncharacterized protein n=1 Tax=Caldinitratiruptor microaerophilus TaxID=671077 RepID=A0AA35CLK5_9FIRM|nr:hypothetical protein [Caldinitratiruptor microaerophilus]BDG61457.1 hypothetical protein caldi_25470 [Caldinitratiruptor microaerophilus]